MKKYTKYLLTVCFAVFSAASFAAINVNFTVTKTGGCSPLVVTFQDQTTSTNPIAERCWHYGDNITVCLSDTNTQSGHVYIAPGFYTVKLVITDNLGNKDSLIKTNYIQVYEVPVISFSPVTNPSCAPSSVCFTNNTDWKCGSISNMLVDYGDGTPLDSITTLGNFCHNYTTPSLYTITAIVRNSCGCRADSVFQNLVEVRSKPTANFSGTPLSTCSSSLNVTFTNASVGTGLNYTWDFGDGNTSNSALATVNHTYTKNNSPYTVKLIATDPLTLCSDTMTKVAYISLNKDTSQFIVSKTSACQNETITFTNQSTSIGSVLWDFGDATTSTSTASTVTKSYTNAGTYTVRLIVTHLNGCIDTVLKTNFVTVNVTPKANFRASDSIFCKTPTAAITFTNLSTNHTSSLWTFTNGLPINSALNTPPSVSFTAAGTVKLVVTSVNGCKDSLTKINYPRINPIAVNFNAVAALGCIPRNVVLTNTTAVVPNDPFVSYAWDFDNNGTTDASTSNTSYSYTKSGCDSVKLTITSQSGCNGVLKKAVCGGGKPDASFTVSNSTICKSATLDFLYTGTPATSVKFYPGLGQGVKNGTPLNANHKYSDTGTFQPYVIADSLGCADTAYGDPNPITVTVLGPKAGFIFSVVCAPTGSSARRTVNFTNTSTVGDSVIWNFSDAASGAANTSTISNPSHVFTTAGCYNVSLISIKKSTGCTDTIIRQVCVYSPVINFTHTPDTICQGSAVTVNNTTLPLVATANNTQWNFLGANSFGPPSNTALGMLNGTTQTFTYNDTGLYTIRMKYTDANGCSDTLTKTNIIRVLATPLSSISLSDSPVCAGKQVFFYNNSLVPNSTIKTIGNWTFSGMPVITGDTIPKTFSTKGLDAVTFSSSYYYSTTKFCKSPDITYNFMVYNALSSFSKNRDSVCVGKTITFQNLNLDSTNTYQWSFQNGTPASQTTTVSDTFVSASFNTQGNQVVRLITLSNVTNCRDTAYDTVTIVNPKANFGTSLDTGYCTATLVQFFDSSKANNITNYFWDFDEGAGLQPNIKNPSNIFNLPGTYFVKLKIVTDIGCTDSITKQAFTLGGPAGRLSYNPTEGCDRVEVTYVIGTRYVKQVTFSTGVGGNIVYTPGFLCGPPPAFCNDTFKISYTSSGTFYPQVVISDSNCVVPPLNKPTDKIVVHKSPNARIYVADSTICQYQTIQLFDSTSYYNPTKSIRWDFGFSGKTDTVSNPVMFYDTVNTFTTTLIVKDTAGCSDTATKLITVYKNPLAAFVSDSVCLGDTNHFTNNTIVYTPATSYTSKWSFGINPVDTSILNNPVFYRNTAGDYTSTVVVTDNNGCMDTATGNSTVYAPPIANFSYTGVCAGSSTVFTNSSTIGSNPFPTNYSKWTFGSTGDTSILNAPSYTFSTGGTSYNVQLIVKDTKGCKDTIITPITIKTNPSAKIYVADSTICKDQTIQLFDSTTYTTPNLTTNWNFGFSGKTSTLSNPFVLYDLVGNYTATLIVKDTSNCVDTATKLIIVYNNPVSEFTPDSVCLGDTNSFVNNSTVSLPATSFTSKWTFAGSSVDTSILTSPKFYRGSTGSYSTQLIVLDNNGCTDTFDGFAMVFISPTANFTYSGVCAGASGTQFTNTSTIGSNVFPTLYSLWDFDNAGNTSTQNSPTYNFPATITYNVRLIVTDVRGCKDTVSNPITIKAKPDAGFTISSDTICINAQTCITDTSKSLLGLINSWEWDTDGDGLIDNTSNAPGCITYTNSGSITLSLFITDTSGCKDTATHTLSVRALPTIGIDDPIGCEKDSMQFKDLTQPQGQIASWLWTFGDNTQDNRQNPTHTYATGGLYPVKLRAEDLYGCWDTTTRFVRVDYKPNLTVLPGLNDTICEGQSIQVQLSGADKYTWLNTKWTQKINDSTYIVTPENTIIDYYIDATNGACPTQRDTLMVHVVKKVPLVASAIPTHIIKGSTSDLAVVVTGVVDSLRWTPSSTLNCNGCTNPKATPPTTTTYLITAYYNMNGYTCSNVDSVTVYVSDECPKEALVMPNAFTPNGDGNNDKFYPRGYDLKTINSFRVFDRWGNLIYERLNFSPNDDRYGWDGRNQKNGQDMENGVYVFYVDAVCSNNGAIKVGGDVILFR